MAEEQDKKQDKPKATLIKHKKTQSAKSSADKSEGKPEKKKVVVVRKKKKTPEKDDSKTVKAHKEREERKAKAAERSKSDSTESPEKQQAASSAEKGKEEAPRTSSKGPKPAPVRGERVNFDNYKRPERPKRTQETVEKGKAEKPAAKQRSEKAQTGDQTEKGRASKSGAGAQQQPAAKEGARTNRTDRPRRTESGDRTRQDQPSGQRRGGRQDTRGRQEGGQRPSGGRPTGQRPSGGRPSGGRPSGGRPGGGAGGGRDQQTDRGKPRSFKKGGPKGGGKPATPAGPPPNEIDQSKKHAAKKFYKSKKKQDYRDKKEKTQEKEFQIKRKPQTQKKANPVPKEIDIMEVITVSELAKKMNLKASELIGKLMSMGMMVTINQQIDAETAEILAGEYGCKVNIVSLYDETIIETEDDNEEQLKSRPPIVTVMGHVDHGKTKLLDAIRETDVVAGEHGGITQHIGAYKVKPKTNGGEIVFLDTPGHEAFTLMRARGAQITDIVILVVAANDGVMPQTIEAVNHAKEAGVPIIVAVNKIDLPEANPDRVKQQLSEYDLLPEDWGGTTLFNEISALNRQGIEELLETLMLQAEILELKANYDCRAEGKVIESQVDHGRGIVSTVIIERGTLHVGDAFVAGVFPGKVRAMFDDKGNKLEEATPATPVEILGFTGIPDAGSPFQVTESERQARQVGAKRQELEKQGEAQNVKKVTLDNLYDSIQEGEIQELKVVIKGDVHGSVEALQTALEKLSTKEIKLRVIHASAGAIIENDVHLAAASNAIIVGFHVRPTPKALELAEHEKIDIRKYNVIYDAVDDIKKAMEGMLAPDIKEEVIGNVEVRDTFKVPKAGMIAGCYVTTGKVKRNSQVHIIRDGIQIYTGKISSLKRFKEDAREVEAGYECGIGIENFNDVKVGDQFEVFETKEIAKTLE